MTNARITNNSGQWIDHGLLKLRPGQSVVIDASEAEQIAQIDGITVEAVPDPQPHEYVPGKGWVVQQPPAQG